MFEDGQETFRLEVTGGGNSLWLGYAVLRKWVWEWTFTDWITPRPPRGQYSMRASRVGDASLKWIIASLRIFGKGSG